MNDNQERIRKHLEGVIDRMEQVIDSPTEVTMKRIEVDTATIAPSSLVPFSSGVLSTRLDHPSP